MIHVAHWKKRSINLLLDNIAIQIISSLFSPLLDLINLPQGWNLLYVSLAIIIQLAIIFSYFVFLECTYVKTLGKIATQTRVVHNSGEPITYKQAALRTLCRLFPLDLITFFESNPIGFHDEMSKTLVIIDE